MRIEREDAITQYRNGATAQSIADAVGITRERVCQLLRPTAESQKRAERARIAREEIAAERSKIKAEVTAAREAKIAKAADLVMGGMSVRKAAAQVELAASELNYYLAPELARRGVKSNFGRWRDFSERQTKVRALHAQGLTRNAIVRELRAGGDHTCNDSWIVNNCADLKFPMGGRRVAAAVTKRARNPIPTPPPNPDAFWTDVRVTQLKAFWFAGISAQQISDVLGCTRNSVIGKVHRLRLAGDFKKEG